MKWKMPTKWNVHPVNRITNGIKKAPEIPQKELRKSKQKQNR